MHPSSSSMRQNIFSSFFWNKWTGQALTRHTSIMMVEEVEEVYTHVHTLHLALAESVKKQSQAKDNDMEGTESLGELELNDLRELLWDLRALERNLDRKQKEAKKVEEMV
ncbi:hypothetical protein M422DRAFT_28413 [Sphaerobolus stellatus SS14]|nr:hypothetical protein M422DRAFT_28413 [Sphaerobolus stellatus SS14]